MNRQFSVILTESKDQIHREKLSVVVPAYNEELSLPQFYDVTSEVLERLGIDWEIVIVNDGSKDMTADVLNGLHAKDHRVKVVHFARNFGNQMAITAGLEHASGDAIVVIDADLQQSPEMIVEMLNLWRQGYEVVNTVRMYGQTTGRLKKWTSSLFYRIMNSLSDTPITLYSSEFRLMDRKVVDAFLQMRERSRFIRAMISWVGYKQIAIPCMYGPRYAGEPAFTTYKLISLAIDGLLGFSTKPLRWIFYLGLLTAGTAVPYAAWAIYQFCFLGVKTPGWASLMVIISFLGGMQLISLGVMAEYIGRIYTEIKDRPLYTVSKKLGFENTGKMESDIRRQGDGIDLPRKTG